MTELKDYTYFEFSKKIYNDEFLTIGKSLKLGKEQWSVISTIDKKGASDLQAVAIVQKKEYLAMQAGKISEYSSMTFVARGTSSFQDIKIDALELGIGKKPMQESEEIKQMYQGQELKSVKVQDTININTQFSDYQTFVEDTLSTNPTNNYNFTGHSLGGSLAQYMAALTDKEATTFAAARAYRLLPEDIQSLVDAGHYDNSIVDYRLDYDAVGNVPFGSVIGSRYSLDYNQLLTGHSTSNFEKYKDKLFDSNGNSKIKVTPDSLRRSAYRVDDSNDLLKKYLRFLHSFIDETQNDMKNLYQHFLNLVGHGDYDLLTERDVTEWFEEHSFTKKGNAFVFYDIEGLEEHAYNIHKLIKEVEVLSENLMTASDKFTKIDHASSSLFERE